VVNKEAPEQAKWSVIQRYPQEGALIIPECPVWEAGTLVRILDLNTGSVHC
jgi:hypothetical protein